MTEKSIFLEPTSKQEVLKFIHEIEANKASGIDGITVKVLHAIADDIAGVLAHIINLSIEQGVCPDHFKVALIIPLYKKGDRRECTNYRPISLLSNLSKVFEKVLKARICSFMEKN